MRDLIAPLTDGIVTGLFLQLAVGPVFFYILNITMDSNYINGLAAVTAVTLADYIFIALSLLGIGSLLEKDKMKKGFGLMGSVVLLLFGIGIFFKGVAAYDSGVQAAIAWTPVKSFTSCFLLTLSSPMTIIFWGSIFSAKAVEKNYIKGELSAFGLGAGAATFIFLSLTMLGLSQFRSGIPGPAVRAMNGLVGILLIGYGVSRACSLLFPKGNRE